MKRIVLAAAVSALLAGPALADHTGTTHKHGPALTPPVSQPVPVSRTTAPKCTGNNCKTQEVK